METVFERDVLFREVWATPISKLAKTYGLSDNGLRKVCIALSIPMPPRGHWQQVAAGRKIKAPALPKTKGPTQFSSRAVPPAEGAEDSAPPEQSIDLVWLRERLAFEKDPANAIVVPAELLHPHPAVAKAAKAMAAKIAELEKARREWQNQRVRRPGERWQPELMSSVAGDLHAFDRAGQVVDLAGVPLRASAATADRALRIWDALIKACALRALTLTPGGVLTAPGYDEKISLRLTERVAPKAGEARDQSRRAALAAHFSKWPSGELRIMIGEGFECKVIDRPGKPLEAQLNSVLASASRQIIANKARSDRRREEAIVEAATKARNEAARLIREEELRVEEEERRRLDDLAEEADAWVQSTNIAAYTANVVAVATASGSPLSTELQRWVDWATAAAKDMDPTKKRI